VHKFTARKVPTASPFPSVTPAAIAS